MFQSEDGTVYKDDGTVIIFSIERFIRDIVQGDCCFICGRSPGIVPFNDEHIIPNWILRKHQLHDEQITLPNKTLFRYSQYTVPCCKECNSLMGKTFEVPISKAFNDGYDAVANFMREPGGINKLFVWLCLIYLKTHLKDLSLRMHRDLRLSDEVIADMYEWEDLHHVHCVARSFLSGAAIDPEVFGSILLLPGKEKEGQQGFDYGDNYKGRSILLKIGESALIAVLNDARAAVGFRLEPEQKSLGHPLLSEIKRPLSSLQLREILTELAYVNMRIDERPVFLTTVDPSTEACEIRSITPEGYHLRAGNAEFYGQMLYSVSQNIIAMLPEPDRTTVREQILTGRYSFLWETDGTQRESDI